MIRTKRTSSHGRIRSPSFGSVALAGILSALFWSSVLAPAARADATPALADASTGSATTTTVGHTVTLTPGSYDADPTGADIQDSWYDCDSANPPATAVLASPVGCTAIASAPTKSYVVTAGEVGDYITVFETDLVADPAQTNQIASNSLQVAPPPPPAPTNRQRPSINGSKTAGSKLTAVPGQWTGNPYSYVHTWSRCHQTSGNTVGNCTVRSTGTATYQLGGGDVGAYIEVSETATNGGGSTTATSVPFGPITSPPPAAPPPTPKPPGAGTAVPTVSGAPQFGATLTAAPVTMSNNPSYAYQWLRCPGPSCTPIVGATGTTYSPVAADLGDALVFSETGTNTAGSGQAQSAKTSAVTAPTETTLQIAPSGVVAGQTATLVATVTSATGQAPPSGTITFEQAEAPIPGCASVTTHPVGASATVTCQTTFAGSASTLSAVFTPTPGAQVTGSDSSAVGFVLGRAATATTMNVPAHVTSGQRVRLRAKVVPQAGTKGVSPTGVVVFLDGKRAITGCTATLTTGVAHCAVTYTALGTHSISVVYLGDGNFSGSGTHVHTLAVLVAKPTGFVSSLMTWTFLFKPHYTRVSALVVTGVPPGLAISVGCSGRGCPKHRYVETIRRAACGKRSTCPNVDLAKHFAGRKLGVGDRLTVRLTHPGWLGKYYSFLIRRGREPKIGTACLAVGETKPEAVCTPA